MNFLSCRYLNLQLAINGYQQTGVPLIIYDTCLKPLFYSVQGILTESQDDIGLYVFLPKLVSALSITLDQGIGVFFFGISFLSLFCASVGFCIYYQCSISRILSIFGIGCLLLFVLSIGDLYVFYVFPIIALIPLILAFRDRYWAFFVVLFFCGLVISIGHYIRSYSGLPVLCFLLSGLFFSSYARNKKIKLLISFIFGLSLPFFYFEKIKRDQVKFVNTYIPTMKDHITTKHPFWHTIYLGFSFLKFGNPDHIKWNDQFGLERARLKKPNINYTDQDYELTLKDEVFMLFESFFSFVPITLFAKLGVLLFYALKYAHLGLLGGLFFPLQFDLLICFLGAMAAAIIFPILAIPELIYCLSFISLLYVYTILVINKLLNSIPTRWQIVVIVSFAITSMLTFVPTATIKHYGKNYFIEYY